MKYVIPLLACLLLFPVTYSQDFDLVSFATGFTDPVDLQNAGDDRLFVVEKRGVIKILNADGSTNATPFLDIQSIVFTPGSQFDERGLLGLAFHPDYQNNGFFYVHYVDNSGDTQISRFSVSGDPDIANASSEFPIIDYDQPFTNHNGGAIAFGPNDGYLYISSGDGGDGGDPGNRAQNTTLLLGKLLRIDVDNPSGGNNYGIPTDNPFAGSATNAEEIWAFGLRNPWKFSFDSDNGDVWIGDVGQGDVEEVNKEPGTAAGLNYGWRCYEGSQPFNTGGCPPMGDLTFPFTEYSSSPGSGNCSVTGGYVSRSTTYPDLNGFYFYADVCSGRVFTVNSTTGDVVNHGNLGGTWVSFGLDNSGEMYIVDLNGEILRIEGVLSVEDEALSNVSILPNPAMNRITIVAENSLVEETQIIDIRGTVVLSEENINTHQKEIDVSALAAGIYLVRVLGNNGNLVVKKLVKQ